jgi:hypothetical protein
LTPSPDLSAYVLALPLEARLLLARQDGPGWWCGHLGQTDLYCDPGAGRGKSPRDIEAQLAFAGWAWLPADSVAWMEAATPEGGWWDASGGRENDVPDDRRFWQIVIPRLPAPAFVACEGSAPECAVAALRARFGP